MQGRANPKATDYVYFIYSSENKRYLKYVLERPKGKSGQNKTEIPTLYCYGSNPDSKRVAFQVKVITALLEQVYHELKLFITPILHDLYKSITNELAYCETSNLNYILTRKLRLQDMLEVIQIVRGCFTSSNEFSVVFFRKIFRKVIINSNSIIIKISFSKDDSVILDNYSKIHETDFSYNRFSKVISFSVFVYIEGFVPTDYNQIK